MAKQSAPNKKFMLACGIICTLCGLLILIISICDRPAKSLTIGLGVVNVILGCLYLNLSRK